MLYCESNCKNHFENTDSGGGGGKAFNLLNFSAFMRYSVWYYKKLGIHIESPITYLCPDVYFDSANYSAITIHSGVTISREVMFLVHDYSVHTAMVNVGWEAPKGKTAHFIKPISVGKDSFIGARVSLLPGTEIGENCIIGAGSVVKGKIPDNSIVIGNPARVIGNTKDWARKKLEIKDWVL